MIFLCVVCIPIELLCHDPQQQVCCMAVCMNSKDYHPINHHTTTPALNPRTSQQLQFWSVYSQSTRIKADNSYMKLDINRKDSHPKNHHTTTPALNPRTSQQLQFWSVYSQSTRIKADNSYMKLDINRKDSHPKNHHTTTPALHPGNLQSIQQPLRDLDAQRH